MTPLGSNAPGSNFVQVADGVLQIANGPGEESAVQVAISVLPTQEAPPGSTNLVFHLRVLSSGSSPIEFGIGTTGDSGSDAFSIPANTSNTTLSFNWRWPSGGLGGVYLDFWFRPPDANLTIDEFSVSFDPPVLADPAAGIPEPATYALIAAGLIAISLVRRRI